MKLEWDNALNTGIQEIDAQHQELYRRINRLLEAAVQGQGRSEIGATIEFLQRYVVTHFQSEQKRMVAGNYPEYAAHKALHDAFVADLAQLKAQFDKDGATSLLVIQVQRRVIDWLNDHIKIQDRKFSQFINR